MSNPGANTSPARLLAAVLGSLLLAAVTLVVFVMPAEHGLDPTGAGALLGIKGMSAYAVSAVAAEQGPYHEDEIEFPLAPFESIEYKYQLARGQAVVYGWRAEHEVVFDFHSEVEGGDEEDAVSFANGRTRADNGTYVAPFSGIHGWFWENRGNREVTVKLRAAGYFSRGIIFNDRGRQERLFATESGR